MGVLNSFFARGWGTSQFNRHMDSSFKVIDVSVGLIQLFKLDKISFYRQIN